VRTSSVSTSRVLPGMGSNALITSFFPSSVDCARKQTSEGARGQAQLPRRGTSITDSGAPPLDRTRMMRVD
jgi:hypothetical protein